MTRERGADNQPNPSNLYSKQVRDFFNPHHDRGRQFAVSLMKGYLSYYTLDLTIAENARATLLSAAQTSLDRDLVSSKDVLFSRGRYFEAFTAATAGKVTRVENLLKDSPDTNLTRSLKALGHLELSSLYEKAAENTQGNGAAVDLFTTQADDHRDTAGDLLIRNILPEARRIFEESSEQNLS